MKMQEAVLWTIIPGNAFKLIANNIAITLIHQCDVLIRGLIEWKKRDFRKKYMAANTTIAIIVYLI